MAKNLKALTDEELDYLRETYQFDVMGDYLVVSCVVNGQVYNRKTLHNKNESFNLTTKMRKITITPQAIEMWLEKYKDNYSLIEVQNAINTLIITYQPLNDEEMLNQLSRKGSKIKEI